MSALEPAYDRRHLAACARADLRRRRRVLIPLGGLMLALGLFAGAIVATQARGEERLGLLALFVVVAVVPGAALIWFARKSLESHPLILALTSEPHRVASVRDAFTPTVEGDHVKVIQVVLVDGGRYIFPPGARST